MFLGYSWNKDGTPMNKKQKKARDKLVRERNEREKAKREKREREETEEDKEKRESEAKKATLGFERKVRGIPPATPPGCFPLEREEHKVESWLSKSENIFEL